MVKEIQIYLFSLFIQDFNIKEKQQFCIFALKLKSLTDHYSLIMKGLTRAHSTLQKILFKTIMKNLST